MIKQHGFTLLEVMIALVIFSIGLIGLAGLQGLSVQNNQVAYSRTIATQLAYDMADRIRNNPDGNYSTANVLAATDTSCVTTSNTCNAATMATYDMWEWKQTVQADNSGLVNPQMFIEKNGDVYTISIGWDENRQGLTGTYNCATLSPPGVECVNLEVTP